MAETERIIDDLDSNKGESDQGEEEDEFWREQRRDLATATTEPFNDELINELQAASKIHTGPIKLTSGADTCALFTEQLQFTHKIPVYPSTHPEGYAYVVPAEFVYDLEAGAPEARPELPDYSWTNLTLADWEQLHLWRSKVDMNEPNVRYQQASE
ncbi:hypothetical protein E4U52_006013 [Claviceps spartinae]|nr:hypothetical protein E4U52_006013 [Claviceps spartinae]